MRSIPAITGIKDTATATILQAMKECIDQLRTSAGGDVTINKPGPGGVLPANTLAVVNGMSDNILFAREYVDLAAAVSACGSDEYTLIITDIEPVTADLEITEKIHVLRLGQGGFDIDSGIDLTITGVWAEEPSGNQLFYGDGNVVGLAKSYPEWFGATTSGDNSAPLQKSLVAGAHGKVILSQLYTASSALAVSPDTIIEGLGYYAGFIFNHTGDGLVSTQAINSSTAVNIILQNFKIYNASLSNVGGAIVDIGGTYGHISRVKIQGFKYGIILDQSEVWRIRDNELIGQLKAGIWIVCGDDHTTSALPLFTNLIWIEGNQFNMSSIATNYNIIDDGGVSHTIAANNFNAGNVLLRASNTYGLVFQGNESEGHDVAVLLKMASLSGDVAKGNFGVKIEGNVLSDGGVSRDIEIEHVRGCTIKTNNFSQFANTSPAILLKNDYLISGLIVEANEISLSSGYIIDGNASNIGATDVSRQGAHAVIAGAITAGTRTVTPSNMQFIYPGMILVVCNADETAEEQVAVTATDATTFTANFATNKDVNSIVRGMGKDNYPRYADNAAAVTAGMKVGWTYVCSTTGVVTQVIP